MGEADELGLEEGLPKTKFGIEGARYTKNINII
jgi:hypothetical protein